MLGPDYLAKAIWAATLVPMARPNKAPKIGEHEKIVSLPPDALGFSIATDSAGGNASAAIFALVDALKKDNLESLGQKLRAPDFLTQGEVTDPPSQISGKPVFFSQQKLNTFQAKQPLLKLPLEEEEYAFPGSDKEFSPEILAAHSDSQLEGSPVMGHLKKKAARKSRGSRR